MNRALRRAAPALLLLPTLAACGSDGPSAPGPDAAPQVSAGATLRGTVGTPDAPEAFEIALTTDDGTPVDVVAAGTYTIVVSDPSQIHNWHLTGDGVDVETDVAGTGESTFEVTFAKGEYTFICDPHPSMSGAVRAV